MGDAKGGLIGLIADEVRDTIVPSACQQFASQRSHLVEVTASSRIILHEILKHAGYRDGVPSGRCGQRGYQKAGQLSGGRLECDSTAYIIGIVVIN